MSITRRRRKNDTHTFVLSDNVNFSLDGNRLLSAVKFDYLVQKNYNLTITATDKGDLKLNKDFTINILDNSTTGIIESENETVQLYPNPVETYLNIVLTGDNFNLVQIYTEAGKLIISKEPGEQKNIQLDLSALDTGLYFVKIISEDNIIVRKVVKQ
ncbi:MAG: T9SS type A sorting domain-containing protein [Bacteroidales bacterium]|nr:T9SS type A sorting domain-containing protein [Bacteroidales bacterium]